MSGDLRIAQGLALPLDAVTRTFGVLGQRGTGKTSAAVVLAEEMVRAGAHIAILDPVGVHWGITRPGTGRGLPGVVIGGEHADVPLEESGGQLVAELVVGRHWPIVVVDMKLLRKGAQRRFMADYLETLYFRNREPLHQFFEEADQALPQTPRGMDPIMGRVLGAGEDIVKLGRSRGLGATLISQRPATVNKNVLEQVESLWLFRLMGPRDRKSAREWIEANADASKEREVMDSLSGLGLGECWLWSPAWLKVLQRINVRQRKTFDSSATPEVGQRLAEPSTRAPIDLDVLRDRMAATIERARADDPKELRKQIAELKRELAQRPTEKEIETVTETVEVPVLANGAVDRLEESVAALADVAARLGEASVEIRGELRRVTAPSGLPRPVSAAVRSPAPAPARPAPPARPESPVPGGDLKLGKAHRSILAVLDQRRGLATSKRQLAVATGYAINGGGFNNPLGALRSAGLIEGSDPIFITDAGAAQIAGQYEPLPTGTALLEHWCRLGKAHGLILRTLAGAYPGSVRKQDLADATGYEVRGGGFNNPLGKLRTLELIEGSGELRLTDAFGDEVTKP